MPEGHTVHRTAGIFQKKFAGSTLRVSSPQGRFTDASLIDGSKLLSAHAWGKQLFLKFEPAILRIHLGIYGKWRIESHEGELPEPKGQVRARFTSDKDFADLRGPTACELVDTEGYLGVVSKLGPDPLRPDPKGDEGERFVSRVLKSPTPIGQLLMNQSVLAGVGNVYRAELLFRAGINPHTPGKQLTREQVAGIWFDAVALMPLGVRTGLMLTRDGFLKGRPKLEDRYLVYKREGLPCRVCGSSVVIEIMATRKLYYCVKCQK
ncbi:MAG: Fpg/Nei family DNA glycosylase [Actinobacteria bacterium]|nr:Fpg/Nei family DNA glycosylase [Actinomycetota bacterium]